MCNDQSACLCNSDKVYWILLMGRMHRTPHLALVVLLSVISSSHSLVIALTIFTVQLVLILNILKFWSLHPVSSTCSISRSEYYTSFCFCSVMHYFRFTLSYLLVTFQVLTPTCTTYSFDVGSCSLYLYHV